MHAQLMWVLVDLYQEIRIVIPLFVDLLEDGYSKVRLAAISGVVHLAERGEYDGDLINLRLM